MCVFREVQNTGYLVGYPNISTEYTNVQRMILKKIELSKWVYL